MGSNPDVNTRREFLGRGLTLAAAAATVPTFLSRAAFALDDRAAAEAPGATNHDRPVLVVIQLAGGNDGLNTLVPYTDDAYHRARPELALEPKSLLKIDDRFGLHPDLAPLKAVYDEGGLGIVQGVGYPNPNRSHFRSMEIWETASDSDRFERYGWIGRYFDNCCQGEPDAGVRVGARMPQAFANAGSVGISLQSPEQYRWYGGDRNAAVQAAFETLAAPTPGASPALDFLQRTALNANLTSAEIRELAKTAKNAADYPDERFARDLKVIAQMIAGGLGTRIYYATLGGFDTHAQQGNQHELLLGNFAAGLSAFLTDLERQGNLERVMVLAFSEFGRRVAENASGGTDHGAAGLMFVAGGATRGGLHGVHPSLTDLDRGDLKFTVDFRSVYATALGDWLGADAKKILGRDFERLALLK